MGWVVFQVMRHAYRRVGMFFWDQWRECGTLLGLHFVLTDRPDALPAFRVGRTIILRDNMSSFETAWWAWHEIAHFLLHPGNILKPLGRQLHEKQERQANEFAALFPVWDVPDVTFETEPKRVVTWDVESERRYLGCLWGGGA